jgi:predicted glycosyltransferase
MRLLVLAIDGRGMGHLNRTLLLARSLKKAEPDAEVSFIVESPAFGLVARSGFEVLKIPDPMHELGRFALGGRRAELEAELVERMVRERRPQGMLIDFMVNPGLFGRLRDLGCKVIVVLRRLHGLAMRELGSDPSAGLVDAWLLPHEEDEFLPGEIPAALMPRCRFTGPLVRGLDEGRVPEVRSRYAGKDTQALVLVAAGGGGWPDSVRLAEEARAAVRGLREERPGIQAVVVYGPLYSGALPPDEPGIRSVRFEPDLPEMMAAADLVICSAGYNSVAEVLASGTSGVLVPLSSPGQDDQYLRAEQASRQGPLVTASLDQTDIRRRSLFMLSGEGPPGGPPGAANDDLRAGRELLDLLRS